MEMKQRGRWILLTLIGLTTLTIWGLSLRSAGDSSTQSNALALPLAGAAEAKGEWLSIIMMIVRKLAHFSECAVLGLWWGLYAQRRPLKLAWLYGLPVAVIDELLQYFAPGRAPGFWDAALDYCGYFCGFALVMAAAEWRRNRKNRKVGKYPLAFCNNP